MNMCSLLIIDDNAPYGPILARLLGDWQIDTATTIPEASRWMLANTPTILIVDEDVHGMAGSAFVAALHVPRPYIVAHSLHREFYVRQQYRVHGTTFDSFIQKPVSGRVLAERLREIRQGLTDHDSGS